MKSFKKNENIQRMLRTEGKKFKGKGTKLARKIYKRGLKEYFVKMSIKNSTPTRARPRIKL